MQYKVEHCAVYNSDGGLWWEGSYWKKGFVSISYRSGEGINGQQGGPVLGEGASCMSLGWSTCQRLPGRLSE